jgi:hypothetical protein
MNMVQPVTALYPYWGVVGNHEYAAKYVRREGVVDVLSPLSTPLDALE